MANMVLSSLSMILFCFCCHYFIRSILTPIPTLNMTGFNHAALNVQRQYRIFAWAVMTFSFLFALVVGFYHVYVEL